MRRSTGFLVVVSTFAIFVASVEAEPSKPRFIDAGNGDFTFDTNLVHGRLRCGGGLQGICSLIDSKSSVELADGPGLLSYYRIFTSGRRFGEAARRWPTRCQLLPDGAVEVTFRPEESFPFTLSAVYRWAAADTLDLDTVVTAKQPLPDFEVFLASYFQTKSRGFVYSSPGQFERSTLPILMAVDVNPLVDGTYLMFPRDRQAVMTIFDGRWERPPNPVQWSITRRMAGPLVVRRDEANGIAVAVMSPPSDCFAVSMPYNKTPPDGPAAHASLYLSLFGSDLQQAETTRSRTRMIVGRRWSDSDFIEAYTKYVEASK